MKRLLTQKGGCWLAADVETMSYYRAGIGTFAESKEEAQQTEKAVKQQRRDYRNADKRKMTYKEKMEFANLEKEIAALEEEQKHIESALCGGTIDIEEITAMSKRLPQLKNELDEKSMRWLELSEMA